MHIVLIKNASGRCFCSQLVSRLANRYVAIGPHVSPVSKELARDPNLVINVSELPKDRAGFIVLSTVLEEVTVVIPEDSKAEKSAITEQLLSHSTHI